MKACSIREEWATDRDRWKSLCKTCRSKQSRKIYIGFGLSAALSDNVCLCSFGRANVRMRMFHVIACLSCV